MTDIGFTMIEFANRVFRPWWKGKDLYGGPSGVHFMKRLVRSPINLRTIAKTYYDLRRLSASKSVNSGLDIFTIVGRRV